MGAFREFVMRRVGGDLDSYRDDSISQNPKPKTSLEIESDNHFYDEEHLNFIVVSSSHLLERYKELKSQLIDVKDVNIEAMFKTDKVRIKFKKWRDKFLTELI